MRQKTVLLLTLLLAQMSLLQGQVIEFIPLASGLGSVVSLAHAGDARMFAVVRQGSIRVIESDGTVLTT
ncbi:MAG: hypothetical protein AAF206_28810, partial [Bacteroidota bacterium]